MSVIGAARSRALLTVAASCAAASLLSGCGGGETAAAAPETVVVTAPASSPAAAPTTPAVPPVPATTPAAPAPVDFPMPNVVGADLQTAQNTMQQMGVLYSVSHDLLGSRNQVLDSGWVVCDQIPAAGQRVTGNVEGTIDFGVVKRGETCP